MTPYWSDERCALYLGDCREVLPALGVTAECIVADPPYGETALPWDQWPEGWLDAAADVTRSLWCFGTLRMYLERKEEFAHWRLSQDIIWEKHNGSSLANDRFYRVHEQPTHWYQGPWRDTWHDTPVTHDAVARTVYRRDQPAHTGTVGPNLHVSEAGGTRLMRSVIRVRSMHHRAIHKTEKPVGLLDPMITYACPRGGLVLDPFAGSGSTLDAARCTGRRAIGVEISEAHCEVAAKRLSQADLFSGEAS